MLEGESGTTSATFEVALTAPSGRTISVDFATGRRDRHRGRRLPERGGHPHVRAGPGAEDDHRARQRRRDGRAERELRGVAERRRQRARSRTAPAPGRSSPTTSTALPSSTPARTPGSTRARRSPPRAHSPTRTPTRGRRPSTTATAPASSCCRSRPTRRSCSRTPTRTTARTRSPAAVSDGAASGRRHGHRHGRQRRADGRRRAGRDDRDRRDLLEPGLLHRPGRRHLDGDGRLRRRLGRAAAHARGRQDVRALPRVRGRRQLHRHGDGGDDDGGTDSDTATVTVEDVVLADPGRRRRRGRRGDAGEQTATFTVTCAGPTSGTSTVDFATADGTATGTGAAGADADLDGVANGADNCPGQYNADQRDDDARQQSAHAATPRPIVDPTAQVDRRLLARRYRRAARSVGASCSRSRTPDGGQVVEQLRRRRPRTGPGRRGS